MIIICQNTMANSLKVKTYSATNHTKVMFSDLTKLLQNHKRHDSTIFHSLHSYLHWT